MKKEFIEIMKSIKPGEYGSTGLIYKGKVHKVKLYDHLEAFKNIFTGDLLERLQHSIESLEEHYRDCEDASEADVHPEWHTYEFHKDDAYTSMMNSFYKDGGVRFFVFSKQMSNSKEEYTINIEGFTSGLGQVASLVYDLRQRDDIVKIDVNNKTPF